MSIKKSSPITAKAIADPADNSGKSNVSPIHREGKNAGPVLTTGDRAGSLLVLSHNILRDQPGPLISNWLERLLLLVCDTPLLFRAANRNPVNMAGFNNICTTSIDSPAANQPGSSSQLSDQQDQSACMAMLLTHWRRVTRQLLQTNSAVTLSSDLAPSKLDQLADVLADGMILLDALKFRETLNPAKH